MNVALLMAVRVQVAIDTHAALKARTPGEVAAERRLHARMVEVLTPLVDRIDESVAARDTLPADPASAQLLLGDLTQLEVDLFDVLADEVGEAAAEAIAHVEQVVDAAAAKAIPDELRPFGMDRRLFDTITNLGGRVLERFATRTVDAMVAAADVGLAPADLRVVLGQMLDGELAQLSRHALGDVRNEATEVAERQLGVTHHMWVTAGDDDVREAHEQVDGEVVALGERFSNGWRRPGGVGCRCHLEPVVRPAA